MGYPATTEEGMRERALNHAINASKEGDNDEMIVKRAEEFYTFLKGGN